MKIIKNPLRAEWPTLCSRPGENKMILEETIKDILEQVRSRGDQALFDLTRKFDGVTLKSLLVSEAEIVEASSGVSDELKLAIDVARRNITKFHTTQLVEEPEVTTSDGVVCWRRAVPIEKVGLYIPGGSAPLFSTILMLAIPATLAGCPEIVLTTPPDQYGKVNPVILYTAQLLGVKRIYKIGGAQAIAAMAFGTESVPSVYKIFGPGNQFVTKAKELVQQDGVAIDMPAGPSEVLVIADESSNPQYVAADLLSQAEHGVDSQVILLTTSESLAKKCTDEIITQLERKEVAAQALENSRIILCNSLAECLEFSNTYAPEHLILAIDSARSWADKISNAGSVFLGHYSCESAGDYASGTNHTLPTNGYARSYSGVSVDSFVKKITFQELSSQGIQEIGEAIEVMATAERLEAHKNAVTVRLNAVKNV